MPATRLAWIPVIVDCHLHLSRFSPEDPPDLSARVDRMRETMSETGISHGVVLTSRMFGDDDPTPEQLLRALGDDPALTVIGGVHCPAGVPENLDELAGLLRERRIRGLKLYPGYQPFFVHDAALRPVYALAAEHGVPVMIHTGDTFRSDALLKQSHPLTVDEIAVAFPEVKFVLCHVGNPWFTDAMEVMYKNENVVADISGFTVGAFAPRYAALMRRRLADVCAYLDRPDKLMFGTDWPICEVSSYLAFAHSLEMTDAEREGLLWRNAARLFGFGHAGE
jgi:uncharacterized protein